MIGVDENENNRADPWELLRWIEWVEEVYQGVCKKCPSELFIIFFDNYRICQLISKR